MRSSFPKRQSTVAAPFCLDKYKGKVSHFSHVRLARQAPLSMGFSRQEYWNGLPCSPPGDLPNSVMEPTSLLSPVLAGGFFIVWATRESFCLEGTLNDLTNLLKLERGVGGGRNHRECNAEQ